MSMHDPGRQTHGPSRPARILWLSIAMALIVAASLVLSSCHKVRVLPAGAALLALSCACVAAGTRSARIACRWWRWLGSPRGVLTYLACVFVLYAWISGQANQWSADHALTDYPDPISYFVQAKIMSGGYLNAPVPQPRDFFNTPYCLDAGRFCSMYPPGWPALLSIGVALRVPWLVNPLLTVLGLLALHRLGRILYGPGAALTAMVLASLWPNVVWFAANYFTEPSCFLFATLAVIGLVGAGKSRPVPHALLCGASLGMLFLIRPYTAMALAVPLAAFWLPTLRRRGSLFPAFCAAVVFGLSVVLHLGYNAVQTGRLLPFPLTIYNPANAVGFGFHSGDIGLPAEYYGPIQAGKRLVAAMAFSNHNLMPFVLPLALAAMWFRPRRGDFLLGACVAAVMAFHVPYFAQGVRHWLPLAAAFALLAVRGALETARFLRSRLPVLRDANLRFSILVPLALAAALFAVRDVTGTFNGNVALADPYRRATEAGLTNAIVFMTSSPARSYTTGLYVQDAPRFDGPVLFGKDLGERNAEVLREHPGRVPYRYSFDRQTGRGQLVRMADAGPRTRSASPHPPPFPFCRERATPSFFADPRLAAR